MVPRDISASESSQMNLNSTCELKDNESEKDFYLNL